MYLFSRGRPVVSTGSLAGVSGFGASCWWTARNCSTRAARVDRPGTFYMNILAWNRPVRNNGTINNGKKAEWPVEQVEGLVTQTVIRTYCLLSSSLSLEPRRLQPPVKVKEIFATAARFPYCCLAFHYSSEASYTSPGLFAQPAHWGSQRIYHRPHPGVLPDVLCLGPLDFGVQAGNTCFYLRVHMKVSG